MPALFLSSLVLLETALLLLIVFRSDILLLRLALAGKALGDKRAIDWAAQLRDRFAAAALRGRFGPALLTAELEEQEGLIAGIRERIGDGATAAALGEGRAAPLATTVAAALAWLQLER